MLMLMIIRMSYLVVVVGGGKDDVCPYCLHIATLYANTPVSFQLGVDALLLMLAHIHDEDVDDVDDDDGCRPISHNELWMNRKLSLNDLI